jgi:DNA-binding transcriptional MerR regulator
MEKSPEAFRTISEVADLLDTPAHVLRFWESRFPQIRPVKRAGGRRYYRPADVALLAGIRHLLHDQGMTIRGVQKILRDHGVRHVSGLVAGSDGAEALEGLAEAQDAGPDGAEAWPEAEVSDEEDRRVIPWPGSTVSAEAEQAEPAGGAAPDALENAPVVTAQPEDAALPAAPPATAEADPPTQAPLADPPPAMAGALPEAPVMADPPPVPADLSAEPSCASAPEAQPAPAFLQGELFADLPQVRAPAPAPVVIEAVEPDSPADAVVVSAPPPAEATPADIRALASRIRHLPPGALAGAGLAPMLARLADLRDRMHAAPRS